MTVISAVIATAGLLLNSPATVVGSMVIAPLIGPAMSAAVGTVVDDEEMFRRGVRMQVLGVAVAIAAATLFAFALRWLALVPPGLDPLDLAEVSERLAPNVLVLVVAIGAGLAGIISLMTGVSAALVGVMIAVALIPPAAAVGRYRDRLSDPAARDRRGRDRRGERPLDQPLRAGDAVVRGVSPAALVPRGRRARPS